jgi:hypothetical protein
MRREPVACSQGRSLVEPALEPEHLVVEVEHVVVVVDDHHAEVGVLAGAEQAVRVDLPVQRAVVAEALEEHLPVVRLQQHHLAHADQLVAERRGGARYRDLADDREDRLDQRQLGAGSRARCAWLAMFMTLAVRRTPQRLPMQRRFGPDAEARVERPLPLHQAHQAVIGVLVQQAHRAQRRVVAVERARAAASSSPRGRRGSRSARSRRWPPRGRARRRRPRRGRRRSPAHMLTAAPSGSSRNTLPGFMMPCGSSRRLMPRIRSSATGSS